MFPQSGGRIEGPERWVRLHLPNLLGVIEEMIGVRQKDIRHKLPHILHFTSGFAVRVTAAEDIFVVFSQRKPHLTTFTRTT